MPDMLLKVYTLFFESRVECGAEGAFCVNLFSGCSKHAGLSPAFYWWI